MIKLYLLHWFSILLGSGFNGVSDFLSTKAQNKMNLVNNNNIE